MLCASAMEHQFIVSLISVLLSLYFLYNFLKQILQKQRTTHKLPPGPWKLPLLGHIHHLLGSAPTHHILSDLSKKHGPLMHLQLGEVHAIVVTSSRVVKEIYKTQELTFTNRPAGLATDATFYNKKDVAFSPYGDYWRQMRKICVVELLSSKRVRSFCSIREYEVSCLVESIHSCLGEQINISQKLLSLQSNVVCRAAFGNQLENRDALIKIVLEAAKLIGDFYLADMFPSWKILQYVTGLKFRLTRLNKKLDEMLENLIKEHTDNRERSSEDAVEEDLIDVLFRIREIGGFDFPITMQNIKAIIFDMFAAGTETAATTMDWAMSELMKNPKVMKKAQTEVRKAFKGRKNINDDDIQQLSYLKLVIKETLRLHPPGPFLLPRESREQSEIEGYTIPKGTQVMVNAWAMGRDPELWHDAGSFLPERFQNSPLDFMGSHFEYIPFGAGKRMCPGLSFALANIELTLAQLLYHFNWKLPKGIEAQELDMSESSGLFARRKTSLYVIASPYEPSNDDQAL